MTKDGNNHLEAMVEGGKSSVRVVNESGMLFKVYFNVRPTLGYT